MKFKTMLILAAAWLASPLAMAQDQPAVREKVSFAAQTRVDPQAQVNGELSIPARGAGKLPAVVVLHSANGIDGTGKRYIDALNAAGIATLELDLFGARGRPPASTRMNLPQVYGSALYLANDPRIDASRIGVMGFSWGGLLSLFSSSSQIATEYVGDKVRFAGHLALYPVCFAHQSVLAGTNKVYPVSVYQAFTGAPVRILAAENDDYDDPDSCAKFVQALPDAAKPQFQVTIYPGVGHGWDSPVDRGYNDPISHKGRGGFVNHRSNKDVAQKSTAYAVGFFTSVLQAR